MPKQTHCLDLQAPASPRRPHRLLCLLVALATTLCTLAPATAMQQEPEQAATELPPSPAYRAPRIDGESIKIDGVIDEAAWAAATVVTEFWEFTPDENVPPPVATEMLLGFDDKNLYVAARAFDPEPGKIRAHLMDRDAIDSLVQDDYVLLMIDSFNDHRRAFQFRVNPLGVQADALNGYVTGLEDWSWDVLWDSAAKITSDGYTVELRLPFNQIPFPEATRADFEAAKAGAASKNAPDQRVVTDLTKSEEAGDLDGGKLKLPGTWRIRLGRSWPRDQRHRWASGPTDFGDACGTCSFNEFTGFLDLKPGRAFEVTPTLTSGRTDQRRDVPNGPLIDGDEDADLGLSGQWNINQSTRLSFAVNPDFSQVEADAAQLNVNERFALFFPEQRPFFLEGVDIFNTPLRAVFTRTVADPEWGLKLTTKKGANTLGVFAAEDKINNILLPSNQGSRFASSRDGLLEGDVLGSVVRYRRDVGERNSIGLLFAGREAGEYSNNLIGIDGTVRLADSDTLSFQALHSDTDYPEELRDNFGLAETAFTGEAINLGYQHFDRDWQWGANFTRFDQGFRADSGFIPRVDVQSVGANITRNFYPKESLLTRWDVGLNASRSEDTSDRLTDSKFGVTASASGPRQSLLFGQAWVIEKRNGPQLFEDLTGAEVFFEMQPSGQLVLQLYAALEDEVDFANNRQADLLQIAPKIELKLGKHIQSSLSLARRAFSNESGTYLEADLAELRFFYHFSTRSFLRAIVQRTAQTNDPSQFVFPIERETEDLFSQLLFSYKLNAQTVFFAGYSDNRVGNEMLSLTQTERSIFIKIGYAFAL